MGGGGRVHCALHLHWYGCARRPVACHAHLHPHRYVFIICVGLITVIYCSDDYRWRHFHLVLHHDVSLGRRSIQFLIDPPTYKINTMTRNLFRCRLANEFIDLRRVLETGTETGPIAISILFAHIKPPPWLQRVHTHHNGSHTHLTESGKKSNAAAKVPLVLRGAFSLTCRGTVTPRHLFPPLHVRLKIEFC